MPNTLGAGLGNTPFPNTTIYPETVDNGYPNALMVRGWCTGVPSDTTASRYAPGAILVRTDAAAGSAHTYINIGTTAVPSWVGTAITTANVGSGIIAIATNGTTPVNLWTDFGVTTNPFSGTITGVFINALNATNGSVTLAVQASGAVRNVAVIDHGTTAGAMVGTITFAEIPFTFGGTASVVTTSTANAIVYATYISAAAL